MLSSIIILYYKVCIQFPKAILAFRFISFLLLFFLFSIVFINYLHKFKFHFKLSYTIRIKKHNINIYNLLNKKTMGATCSLGLCQNDKAGEENLTYDIVKKPVRFHIIY